ncbi:TetR/AcrR family transcriptional regulator [uncultured Erythrobacter sp.]|uniref:TetR/AcrR family transcriptional regulator n=1 Tax=uncultured Erythrobacter sp. TaxID=263913 RepID=UPI0026052302|nr:TetR/AcrR family transcriptional regulator [uncultured Erythrobacter sp.]
MDAARTKQKKPQKRTLETRAAILAAAEQLFAERGFAATGVRDVAEVAGCNQALVSYHFKGKAGLYDAVLGEAMQSFVDVAGLPPSDNSQPVRNLIRGFASAISARPYLAPILMREYMNPDRLLDPDSGAMLRQSMGLTERMIASLPDNAPAKALDAQTVHLTVLGPMLLFLIAAPVREALAKRDPTVKTPTLETFASHLADMLEPALE